MWIPQCAAPLDVTVTCAIDSFVDSPAGPFVFSRGGPGILDVTVTYARDSFCGFTGWAFYPLEGGPRYPGTSLTVPSSGTVLGHLQGSLQCHFSRCKVVLCFEDDVLYQVHRVDQGLCSVFIKGVVSRGCRSGP